MSDDDPEALPRAAELSKVPSWILLGFVFGAAFVLLFRLRNVPELAHSRHPVIQTVGKTELTLVAPSPLPPSPVPRKWVEPSLDTLEAIWERYGDHAVWVGDVTEVALWNSENRSFRDCFEVVRRGDQVYFRSIPHLSRPIADRGLGPTAPVQFTGLPIVSSSAP